MQQATLPGMGKPNQKKSRKNRGYIDGRRAKDGLFQPDIYIEVNEMLNVYCRIKNVNKTRLVNAVLKEWLEDQFDVMRDE